MNDQDFFKLQQQAYQAEQEWQAELVKQFGKSACNVRYTQVGKEASPELYTKYSVLRDQYLTAMADRSVAMWLSAQGENND